MKEDFNYNAYSLLVRRRDNSYLEDTCPLCVYVTIISYDIYIYTHPHFGQGNFLSRQIERDIDGIENSKS